MNRLADGTLALPHLCCAAAHVATWNVEWRKVNVYRGWHLHILQSTYHLVGDLAGGVSGEMDGSGD